MNFFHPILWVIATLHSVKRSKSCIFDPEKYFQMKFKHYLVVFIAAFGMSFFLASCLNEANKIPPNCYDGIQNNGEEGIDCGGPCNKECDHCNNGIFEPEKGETWVDCGGSCPPCAQCANGIKDGDEIGIDCGGSCGSCEQLCDDGLLNGLEDEIDCQNAGPGVDLICNACPTCDDGIMNGDEVGIDCGGTKCAPCCKTNSCRNGVRDGDEFWTDCGGSICPNCPDTLYFKLSSTNTKIFLPSEFMGFDSSQSPVITVTSQGATSNGGDIALVFSEYPTPNQAYNLETVNPAVASIAYTDELGITYSSAYGEASGKITFVKKAEVYVPDDDLDGCHKPSGQYRYWRATFSNVVIYNDTGDLSVSLTDGTFQITIKP